MRLRDYANDTIKPYGGYILVKRAWEKQVSVFKGGKVVEIFHNINEAKEWIRNNNENHHV